MADVLGNVMVVLELLWTFIKMHAENIRCVYRTFVPKEPKDVRGEITLITGAGHGMGREMALRFAKLGAVVVCVDINATGNQDTAQAIRDNGGKAHTYECDVSDRAAVFSLADKVTKEVGEVTILVNNAGIMPCQPFLNWTEKNIRSTVDINVMGNFWMLQAFLPAMKKRNHGHIVALSSMAGHMGVSYLVPYCGTKFAIRGIMEALENELYEETNGNSNIKFTTICPGTVDTGLAKNPRSRFEKGGMIVDAGEAADIIVDAVRRDQWQITIPVNLFYVNKITGAGHGMGREMALRFAKLGAVVVCVDINATGNQDTAQAIRDNGGKAHTYECDVSDRAAVFSLADKVTKEVGEVTILVNNAGIMPCQPFLNWTEKNIRSTVDINVMGNFWMLQAFLPAMKKRNHGHIVALSSMAGHMGVSYLVPYCGTKFAIRGIMEALENELYEETNGNSNIKFTTICPSTVDTGLAKNPRSRLGKANKIIDAGEAADLIVDAVRRDQWQITIPLRLFYVNKFFTQFLSPSAFRIMYRFIGAGVNPHD